MHRLAPRGPPIWLTFFIGFAFGQLLISCVQDVSAQDVKTFIPTKAVPLLPVVQVEQNQYFSELPYPAYLGGLFEHESCISLKHSRCWSPTSELRTSREQGTGLAQLTRAWDTKGNLRFDTLTDLRRKHPEALKELTWDNIRERPDLQIRAGVLLVRENYKALYPVPNTFDRLAMADASYNGGLGNVKKGRTACGLAKGCDPNLWFNQTERYMPQSRAVLYGDRSAYNIVTHHPKDVLLTRQWKYRPYLY